MLGLAILWLSYLVQEPPLEGRSEQKTNAHVPSAAEPSKAREAARKGLVFLEKEGMAWMKTKTCASCHHIPMMLFGQREAAQHGIPISDEARQQAKAFAVHAPRTGFWGPLTREKLAEIPGPSLEILYLALGLGPAEPSERGATPVAEFERHLRDKQEPDGSWVFARKEKGKVLAPIEDSDEVITLLALLALPFRRMPALEQGLTMKSQDRALTWLREVSLENSHSSRTLGLVVLKRFGLDSRAERLLEQLLRKQREDGGWSQGDDEASDALATGQALFALAAAGLVESHAATRRALAFLARTQRENGSWRVMSRILENKGKDEIPSYFGTAWATIGLVQYCGGTTQDKPAARFLVEWGHKGADPGEFNIPMGVAIGPKDEVFVTDFHNDRVQKFDPDGKLLGLFPVAPHPAGIAVDKSGTVYVTHFGFIRREEQRLPDKVSVYDATGKRLRDWGKTGAEDGAFDFPGGIALAKDGKVYVADSVNRRIQVFTSQGVLLAKWGSHGTKPGQFDGTQPLTSRFGGPIFVTLDHQGMLYTTEAAAGRVQQFTAEGNVLQAWGTNDDQPGGFGGFGPTQAKIQGPIGICVDNQGRIWVTSVSSRVQRFSSDGTYLGGIGVKPGREPGQFQVPHGLTCDRQGHLYVADSFNHRIQKLAIADP